MKQVRDICKRSWLPELNLLNRELGQSLGLPAPLSLTTLCGVLDRVEERTVHANSDSDALHGRVDVIVRSDGTYRFKGRMRATGLPSFSYKLQVIVRCPGVAIALESSGTVYGTDTPGDRVHAWDESGRYEDLTRFWAAIRMQQDIELVLDKNLAGTSGALTVVARTVVSVFAAAYLGGPIAAVIALGANLAAEAGVTIRDPNLLIGIVAAGSIMLVFGPGYLIPAVAAGAVAGTAAGIRHRGLTDAELALARSVFRDTIPYERIVLTDLHSPDGYREFVCPSIDGSIWLNMGRNFNAPLATDANGRGAYAAPGSVLIHELAHAWQIAHSSFLPGLLCAALSNRSYTQEVKTAGNAKPWSDFGLEQQGSIVDSWFSDFRGSLDAAAALDDPRFRYISQHIRAGHS